jgi:hypothetical protein
VLGLEGTSLCFCPCVYNHWCAHNMQMGVEGEWREGQSLRRGD